MRSGPVIIGYDGSEASERAVEEAGQLLGPRPALVVVVWEAGLAFEAIELPAASVGIPPVPLDLRTALEMDRQMYESAERLAQRGAGLARDAGFDAEGLAVADDLTVADTLVRIAEERDAQTVVVGSRGRNALAGVLLGSTSQGVIRRAPCPVVVARAPEG